MVLIFVASLNENVNLANIIKNKLENKKIPEKIEQFSLIKQYKNIDILLKINNFSIIIEDKTGIKQYLRENGGIRVYRDGMRVYDYGEIGNDWLGLDRKRINAPTAKIGNKLILGSIQLSRKDSKGLIEKTNREGFIENDVYSNFQEAIVFILNKINNLRKLRENLYGKLFSF